MPQQAVWFTVAAVLTCQNKSKNILLWLAASKTNCLEFCRYGWNNSEIQKSLTRECSVLLIQGYFCDRASRGI